MPSPSAQAPGAAPALVAARAPGGPDRPAPRADRYRRLAGVAQVGSDGAASLGRRSVTVVGCGALGGATAAALVRAGVGSVTVVDRDVVEEANLADQCLYTEADAAARRPKAEAAAERLAGFNRHVAVRGRVADLGCDNAEALCAGADLVIDAVDDLEAKYLLNDVAVATATPWVMGGCAGALGIVLAVVPGRTRCLRCVWPQPPARVEGCASMGVLPSTIATVSAFQVAEALKLLLGRHDELIDGVLRIDAWHGMLRRPPLPPRRAEGCAACGRGELDYLRGRPAGRASVLCGGDTVLVREGAPGFDYAAARRRLAGPGSDGDDDWFSFEAGGRRLLVFRSGRALVHGTGDPVEARAIYGRYLGP